MTYSYRCTQVKCDNGCVVTCNIDPREFYLEEQMACPFMVDNVKFERVEENNEENV